MRLHLSTSPRSDGERTPGIRDLPSGAYGWAASLVVSHDVVRQAQPMADGQRSLNRDQKVYRADVRAAASATIGKPPRDDGPIE